MILLIPKSSIIDYISRKIIAGKYARTNGQISDILFFTYINVVKQKNSFQDVNLEPLHIEFNKLGVPSHLLGNEWWQNFYNASISDDEEGFEAQAKLVNLAENVVKNLSFEYWMFMHIYCLSTRLALFKVSNSLRKISKLLVCKDVLENKKFHPILLSDFLAALIEDGRFDEARLYIELLLKVNPSKGIKFQWLLELLTNEDVINFSSENRHNKYNDAEFNAFVKNKSIAVVSPALISIDNSMEIDSFDIVVKCNLREKQQLLDGRLKGSRCDVTYLTKKAYRTLELKKFREVCNDDLKWLVVRQLEFRKLKQAMQIINKNSGKSKPIFVRTTSSFDDITYFGSGTGTGGNNLNAIPNIILDLLRFNPSNISLFHSDLMITYKRYCSSYDPENCSSDIENINRYLRSFSHTHHPESQFLLLKQLMVRKKISGDDNITKILACGLLEYVAKLQGTYGKFRLPLLKYFSSRKT